MTDVRGACVAEGLFLSVQKVKYAHNFLLTLKKNVVGHKVCQPAVFGIYVNVVITQQPFQM